jgi:CheY-like chemotaxis protein
MPRFELHQCLSAFGKPIPTILITAYPDDAVRERALSAGLIGYLSKPLRRMICSPHPLGSDTRP